MSNRPMLCASCGKEYKWEEYWSDGHHGYEPIPQCKCAYLKQINKTDYDRILERIELGRKRRDKELYLVDMKITHLPEELLDLPWIEKINLRSNTLTNLPDWFGNFRNLRWLCLYDCQLQDLNPSLSRLKNLEYLEVGENQLLSLPSWISYLAELRYLALGDNQIIELPETLGNLSNLEELYIYSNHLRSLPSSTCLLRNLRGLYASDNELSSLPPHFDQLTNLKELSIGSNKITNLPPHFDQLTNLEEISIGGNEIANISLSVLKLPKLKPVHAGNNPLDNSLCEVHRMGPASSGGGYKDILALDHCTECNKPACALCLNYNNSDLKLCEYCRDEKEKREFNRYLLIWWCRMAFALFVGGIAGYWTHISKFTLFEAWNADLEISIVIIVGGLLGWFGATHAFKRFLER